MIMEGIWASIENTSEKLWSSIEEVWANGDKDWWGSDDGPSQWDQFIYFINAVSQIVTIVIYGNAIAVRRHPLNDY